MIGTVIGDVCGSIYEFDNYKTTTPTNINLTNPKCFLTDDSVLTIAVAEAILTDGNYCQAIRKWAKKCPTAGYGWMFRKWIHEENFKAYNSFGNGSAMRVSPVGYAFNTLEETLTEAKKSSECTHNHPEGIKGAQATAAAIFLARNGASKEEIRKYIVDTFEYDLSETTNEIRSYYKFDVTCKGTVPKALIAFFESNDFEHSIQLGISIGGDTDTLCAIIGGISQAFYNSIPQELMNFVFEKINLSENYHNINCGQVAEHKMQDIIVKFQNYLCKNNI